MSGSLWHCHGHAAVASVSPIKVLQAALSLLWPKSSTTSSSVSAPLPTKLRLAVVSLPASAESDLRLAQSKAVKSDDAQTNETLWNTNAAAVPTIIRAWNGVVQTKRSWFIATGTYDPVLHGPLFHGLRLLMVKRFAFNVRTSGAAYLHSHYTEVELAGPTGLDLERDKDVAGVTDCNCRASQASFWDWNGGSSPFFWRGSRLFRGTCVTALSCLSQDLSRLTLRLNGCLRILRLLSA